MVNKELKEKNKKEVEKKRVFGNGIISEWFCSACHYHIFPNTLRNLQNDFVWTQTTKEKHFHPCCPKCSTTLQYDEAE